ncbi:membrane protein [Methanothrix sp.]|uniref:Membrane protein n=3 Tax=Methanothrix TaxID=2222 RepID=F4C052_METSG|nr:membrane protein [Methanothrix sp.]AEB67943.1 membrane protein [Methanothrix soehngenii GP6]
MAWKPVMNFNLHRYLSCKAIAGMAGDGLYRTSFFMAFANIMSAGCGFFFWIIAARLYALEQVGLATALISSLALVALFSTLGFDSSIIRFLPLEDKGKVISTSFFVTTGASIIFGGICILLMMIMTPSMPFWQDPGNSLAFILVAALNSIAVMGGYAFVADRKADHYFLQNLLQAIRIPALVPLAFLGVFGIFGAIGLGYLTAALYSLTKIQLSICRIRPQADREFIRKSLRFSSLNYLSSLLYAAPTLMMPILVLSLLDEAEAAKYYIAFALGTLVLIIPSSFGTSLFVEGSHGNSLKKSAFRAGGASLMIMLPAVLVLFFYGDQLLGLLRGEYVEGFGLLKIIALSSFPVACYSLFIPIQNVRMRVESIVKLNALRCILLLGLSYVMVNRYGILGAGYAWMITYMVIVIWVGWVALKEKWI